ncbi:hypothetical protein ACFWYW_23905 [Nonomuraea sp. NPDC059023]|uniref:hypothetical protein n=1 Tax=unclassified Nonomuraea TaxID=2593643 RepID=UPI00369D652E
MGYQSASHFLDNAAQSSGRITVASGHSGYFSTPDPGLDPALFDGQKLRPHVRDTITGSFTQFMRSRFRDQDSWTRLWLAGSGISHQWSGDRGNGDLDVMVGINPLRFRQLQPEQAALSEPELADFINSLLRAELWPQTARTHLGGKVFELTYYWNPATTNAPGGVTAIHPYAAYDLTADTWTVRPPRLPADPRTLYPADWWAQVDREAATARDIIARYNAARGTAQSTPIASPGHTNAMTALHLAVDQASHLFDDIHTGRHQAFGPGGHGYGDFANFRWQAAKASGIGPALAEIAAVGRQAALDTQRHLYGQPLAEASTARLQALLWSSR